MLQKSARVNLKFDFKWVARGRALNGSLINLFYRFGENSLPKVGIAIKSKFFKNAVERNRARRVCSVFFEKRLKELPESINIIVLPKSGVVEVKSDLVEQEIAQLLKNEKVIN